MVTQHLAAVASERREARAIVVAARHEHQQEATAHLTGDEGYRDRARLTWILRGKRVGFSLNDIRELLDLYDVGDQQNTQMRATLDRCRERIDILERQKHDIDATIAELDEFCGLLNDRLQQKES